MRLYIAEKPSLARAIAAVLPKPQQKHNGYIQLANGDCVTWCIGHLLEQAEPEHYDAKFKQWRLEHLPIFPDKWQWKAKSKTASQLKAIKSLVKQASSIVHAGDPDREGQLLVDLVIEHSKAKVTLKQQCQRLLISDLNPAAVSRALKQLKSNQEFSALSTSALARSRADWLYGINLTRAYTLKGQQQGYSGVLSVGRVQTPILGLVVRRDQEIAEFVSRPYYQVEAHLHTEQAEAFTALWQPSEACEPYQDEEGRVLSRPLAEHVVKRVNQQAGLVQSLKQQDKQQAPPLPYNLSSLQIDAAKRFAYSAKQVLDICQGLYERHNLITYPRSDSRYLPKQHHAEAPKVVAAIQANSQHLEKACVDADLTKRSKAWNDAKVEAHHAIIPTEKRYAVAKLGEAERNVYELIARQYLLQFYPHYQYAHTEANIVIADGHFKATANQIKELGWKALFPQKKSAEDMATLPPLKQGQVLQCVDARVLDKQTQPPKAFTDATLLAAMTGIAKYVQDPSLKAVLKDTDGLGTEATRAGILELLFKRGFLLRQAKQIHASDSGKALINALPALCTWPDMTAHWETQLNAISQKAQSYQGFMQGMQGQLSQLVEQSASVNAQAFAGLAKPASNKAYRKKRTNNKGGSRSYTKRAGSSAKKTSRKAKPAA
ncbi:DNA topoisomerase III [Agarivorans albus]|uniref:DNA topoisomerase 3 n=1 Tax=Agarivorans albus MKT 106 TaxID=1331007 RepID=R9PMT2_AGAAL|nr:DNA topoisomerase III [Agarivorans albus]GAD02583.1 DNA topoisomerase III [Agarivorans albus MKT 106]